MTKNILCICSLIISIFSVVFCFYIDNKYRNIVQDIRELMWETSKNAINDRSNTMYNQAQIQILVDFFVNELWEGNNWIEAYLKLHTLDKLYTIRDDMYDDMAKWGTARFIDMYK
jgi:hypothetical protein